MLFLVIAAVLLGLGGYRVMTKTNRNHSLLDAVRRGDSNAVVLLLREGADANARADGALGATLFDRILYRIHGPRNESHAGPTALDIAITPAPLDINPDVVIALIKGGADVEARNRYGQTPLMIAVEMGGSGNVALKLLLANHADVNARDRDGVTCLCTAAIGGDQQAVRLLLNSGADVTIKTNDGVTPLMYATSGGSSACASLILARGDSVNARDNAGRTALTYAAADANVPMLGFLLRHGADSHVRTVDGLSVLDAALATKRRLSASDKAAIRLLLGSQGQSTTKNKPRQRRANMLPSVHLRWTAALQAPDERILPAKYCACWIRLQGGLLALIRWDSMAVIGTQ